MLLTFGGAVKKGCRKRTRDSNFQFIRNWPREALQQRIGKKLLAADCKALQMPGVYVLYCGREPYYIGKGDCLLKRLSVHANKIGARYFDHWTHFSAFSFKRNSAKAHKKMNEFEGVLIAAMPQAANNARPRWSRVNIPTEIRARLKQSSPPRAMSAATGR